MLHQLCQLLILAAAGLMAQESSDADQELHAEAQQILALPTAEQDLIRLVQIDLSLSDEKDPASLETCRTILRTLAVSENETAMEHVRAIFENDPERRGLAAWALSRSTTLRPADLQDWRYMVRSLNVVSGDDAASVMKALMRFRVRANKPQWVRQVILIGLQMTPEQQPAAINLLKHWTTMPKGKDSWKLSDYQAWFAKEHPEHPEAVLPVDSTTRKWTLASLQTEIQNLEPTPDMVATGEKVYEKAGCQKCHRRSKLGQAFGPDLTSLGWRRQKKEILHAILFPSHDLNEEYPSVLVVLKDGRTLNGVLSSGAEGMMSVVSNTAVRVEFLRTEIEKIVNQKISNMPEGTLEPMTMDEIKALFAYLTSVDGVLKPHGDELE
ncbi:MAG: c-type cytochrome [Planctomycetales bacterium]|nr:c-type cytochrome [Planctomycetales bacterium]